MAMVGCRTSALDEDGLDGADIGGPLDVEALATPAGSAVEVQPAASSIRKTFGAAIAHWPWSWHRSRSTVTFIDTSSCGGRGPGLLGACHELPEAVVRHTVAASAEGGDAR